MTEAWAPARPFVHSIAIELTGYCNQRCGYCYNAWREDGGASVGTPSPAELLSRLDRILDAASVEHVTLTGGEPLASPHLFQILDYLRGRHVRAQMISNGGLVTDAIADRLARHRLLAVLVTLNGPDAETHDDAVAGKGHFEATLAGIARLRARRVAVEGSIVITRKNASKVSATLDLFASLGVTKIALSRFSPAGYSVANARELLPSPADVTSALEAAASFARASSRRITLFATMPIPPCVVDVARFPEIDFHDCPIGKPDQEFALGPRGELRHCTLHASPLADAAFFADPASDVAALFASGDPHRYRATLPAACEGCAHATTCAGGCGAAAAWAHGVDSRERDPFASAGLRAQGDPNRDPSTSRRLPVVP